ncbi:MAG: TonB-dependent receptor [Cyanobacteria bacterium NC_groundwater_1444_Ag_S-0.65um_54_12]|nr:TonB-dependent receptor [Cyanobacteria bacterium NC_groundwater_1444_Ag_S-0.65um_54_12]
MNRWPVSLSFSITAKGLAMTMSRCLAVLGFPIAFLALPLAMVAATLEGTVHDKQTTEPIAGATITVVGSGSVSRSDQTGRFAMPEVRAGQQAIKIEASGYLPLVLKDLPLHDDRPVVLHVELRRGFLPVKPAMVTANSPSKLAEIATSRRSITGEEVRQTAGARNDPILAIANTAGVKSAGFSGAPAVRGGGPNDNRYLMDGIEIGNPYHFGGLVSVFNAGTISKVDLYSGALPARHGNALSAVIAVETRPPHTKRMSGIIDSNLLYSEALIEGPLGKDVSLALAGRRSYIDVVAGPLLASLLPAGTVLPYFTDYQGKLTARLPGGGWLDLVGIGAQDAARIVLPEGGVGRGIGEVSLDGGYRSTGAIWRQPFGDTLSHRLTLNYQEPYTDLQVGRFLSIQDYRYRWTIADELMWQAAWQHQLRFGMRYDTINYLARRLQPDFTQFRRAGRELNIGLGGGGATGRTATGSAGPNIPTAEEIEKLPKKTTDTAGNQKVYGAYVEEAWQPVEPLTLSLGLRYDKLQSTAESCFGPRTGLSWRMAPGTTLRLAYGQQYQFPGEDQLLPGTGNPVLHAAFSKDYVAGADHQLTDQLGGRLELYYRNLFGLVAPDPTANFTNSGAGRSYGAELTLEIAETLGWSGSLALTLSRSFRTPAGEPEIPYEYDQPVVANLVAKAPNFWGWSPSLKLRFSSGRPYTPVIGRKQEANGTWSPVRDERNSEHFPDGMAWSARCERTIGLFGLDDRFYLEVTQQADVLGVDYGKDYELAGHPTFNYGLPPLPYLGYQIRF